MPPIAIFVMIALGFALQLSILGFLGWAIYRVVIWLTTGVAQ